MIIIIDDKEFEDTLIRNINNFRNKDDKEKQITKILSQESSDFAGAFTPPRYKIGDKVAYKREIGNPVMSPTTYTATVYPKTIISCVRSANGIYVYGMLTNPEETSEGDSFVIDVEEKEICLF